MIDWLTQRARSSPEKTALIFEEQIWSYAVLNQRAEEMARQLLVSGIGTGHHVAALALNCPEYVVLIHALIKIGAVLIALNSRLTFQELTRQIKQADADLLIYSDAFAPIAKKLNITHYSFGQLSENGKSAENLPQALIFDNPQSILFTSGTTGKPKGVVLTIANHFWSATASAFRLGLSSNDRWLLCLPLYHVGGMAIILRSCLYGTAVVLHQKFSTQQINVSIERHTVTMISLVPTMLHRLIKSNSTQLDKLRVILLGGGAAPQLLIDQSLNAGLPVVITYGLTEACSQVATMTLEHSTKKIGSAGKPLMFTQVQIENPGGAVLPAGEIGEIIVRGPGVMQEYYRCPEATRLVLQNDRLRTGDMGYLDEDGDLWVMQRRTDLIVTGGENVYPSEIEEVLQRHPDIEEACVIGLAHPVWGQKIAAVLVLRDGKELSPNSLEQYCRNLLAGYKIPREIQFVKTFPRTSSGKINRYLLRRDFKES